MPKVTDRYIVRVPKGQASSVSEACDQAIRIAKRRVKIRTKLDAWFATDVDPREEEYVVVVLRDRQK
jgi:hypothetical protein